MILSFKYFTKIMNCQDYDKNHQQDFSFLVKKFLFFSLLQLF